jgi:hypothetical protein
VADGGLDTAVCEETADGNGFDALRLQRFAQLTLMRERIEPRLLLQNSLALDRS